MKRPMTYAAIEALGRERLSSDFFMREFLYSEIAHQHRLHNFPHFPEVALETGRRLCTDLLEPLQATFGRIHVRSGYRSPEVNDFGNKNKLNCASNEQNFSVHIWDYPDSSGVHGAAACIVVPVLADYIAGGGSWQAMAWWIHDHLPYSALTFFSRLGAFNIGWHERPARRIDSYAAPQGCLVRPGTPNSEHSHESEYAELLAFAGVADAARRPAPSAIRMPEPSGLQRASLSEMAGGNRDDSADASGRVNYRAVHTRTAWRHAVGHKSEESAIHGPNGAAALFAGRVRTDYERHGDPLYVLIWLTGAASGKIIRPAPGMSGGITIAEIPTGDIEQFEHRGEANPTELASYFER